MNLPKRMTLYRLVNTAEKGLMPQYTLSKLSDEFYAERVIGYNRQYAAMGVNQRVDILARIWRNCMIRINDYAVLEDGNQYRIDFIQHMDNDDGLPVTDLTLVRLEENYDVAGQA